MKRNGHFIFAAGRNGAEAYDYVDGKFASQLRETLRGYGSRLRAVFISGGGNDFAGLADLRPLLKNDCSGETEASGCFTHDPGLDTLFSGLDESCRRLVGLIHTHTHADCAVVMHTYDYANPTGAGVLGTSWLKPALDDAKVPPGLQRACVKELIDRFAVMLHKICATDPGHFLLVDSRGTLEDYEWANELHPTSEGCRKIVEQRWRPALQQARLI